MTIHPYRNVAIAAAFNTPQALTLDGHTSLSISLDAAVGVLEEAGMPPSDVDAVFGQHAMEIMYMLGIGPARGTDVGRSLLGVLDAAGAVAAGTYRSVIIAGGWAGVYRGPHDATAPWTRPGNEFMESAGMYTAIQFALVARRHMEMYGTTPDQLAKVAATIRNNGHVNPEAVYHGRGPFTPDDILASRMIAEPFHLLDCAMTSEGGAAVLVTTADRARDLRRGPVYVLGGSPDCFGPSYTHPPAWDLRSSTSDEDVTLGTIGRRASRLAFATAGLTPQDVDCCEFYDPFSFEIIRQFEAFGFCGPGEGGEFVAAGNADPGGRFPVTTDGGTMSFSHSGWAQILQRVVRGVHQLQHVCPTNQVPDAHVALCTSGGSGAFFNDVILLGSERP